MWVLLGTFSKHVGILWCIYCKEKYTFACQRLRSSHFMMNFISKKKSPVEILYLSLLYGWVAGSQSPNEFQKPEVKPPPVPILLCLYTAIEPQKEEADENYNSVNTRMRKTQVGSLFPEVGHFSKCSIYH